MARTRDSATSKMPKTIALTAAQARPRRHPKDAGPGPAEQQVSTTPLTAAQARPRRDPKAVDRFEPPQSAATCRETSKQRARHDEEPQAAAGKRRRSMQQQPAEPTVQPIDPVLVEKAWRIYVCDRLPESCNIGGAGITRGELEVHYNECRQSWRGETDELRLMYVSWVSAPSKVLMESPDLLMSVFQQLPTKATPYNRMDPLATYSKCRLVCKHWNAVLRGTAAPGLERNAGLLLCNLLKALDTPHWLRDSWYGSQADSGCLARPRFCEAMALSTRRANIIAEALPVQGTARGIRFFPMPHAFDKALELEGGWAGLMKRWALRASRRINKEAKRANELAKEQREAIKSLKQGLGPLLEAVNAGSGDLAVDDLGSPGFWRMVATVGAKCIELERKQGGRVGLARNRGGGHAVLSSNYADQMRHTLEAEAKEAEARKTQAAVAEEDGSSSEEEHVDKSDS